MKKTVNKIKKLDKKSKVIKKVVQVAKVKAKVTPKIVAKAKSKIKAKIAKTKVKPAVKIKAKLKVKARAVTKTKTKAKKLVKAPARSGAKAKVVKKIKTPAKMAVKKPAKIMAKATKVKVQPKVVRPVAKTKGKVKIITQAKALKSGKSITKSKKQEVSVLVGEKNIFGPTDVMPYRVKEDEEYMNDAQLEHFRAVLLQWKNQLMEEVDRTVHHMQDEAANYPDPVDRATQEEEFNLELRARDRDRKLLRKIEETLGRINDRDYGYCDDCGVEIGIKRLEARPTATQCIECKTIAEIREKQIGEGG